MTKQKISIVVPVYNEQANIEELIDRCVKVGDATNRSYEIVLADDGSADDSVRLMRAKVAQYPGKIIVIVLNRNYGQHTAVIAGLGAASGDIIVTLDADLQNLPEEIPKLLAQIDAGCDVVGSVRQQRQDSWFRRQSSALINRAVRRTTGVMMRDYGCMLRAYRRPVVDAILQCSERSTFIPVLANSFASKTGEVEVAHASRSDGETKYGLWKLINLQFDLLTMMTTFPLRLLTIIGSVLAILGFAAGSLLLVLRLVYGAEWAANGVLTVFAGLFFFGGVQLLGLGLMGEYIGRIYNDVRSRPRYFIRETISTTELPPQQSVVTLRT